MGVAAAPVLVWAMASGLQQDPRGFEAAVFMTRWMFPYIGFMSLVALSAGVLNTWKRFAVPAATPVLLNLCHDRRGLVGRAMVRATGYRADLCPGGGRDDRRRAATGLCRYRRSSGLDCCRALAWAGPASCAAWADPATQKIARLMVPALLGVSVAQISLLINTQIASHLVPGSVSWLTYADRLMEFPTAIAGCGAGRGADAATRRGQGRQRRR